MPISRTSISFRDRGFRFAVIDALWNLGYFKAELAKARDAGGEPDDDDHDPAIEAALAKLVITPAMLAKIRTLAPDGGDEIYEVLGGGGDCRGYDLGSLVDVALLPKLEKLQLFAMCTPGIDLAPLLACTSLVEVTVRLGGKPRPVLAKLARRGVAIG